MLKHLGYGAGLSGGSSTYRQAVLARAFELAILPRIESQEYVLSWGSARSAARLKKMAESIAAFCRNAKRRDEPANKNAINDWETDLAWLKRQYYDERFAKSFNWPSDE